MNTHVALLVWITLVALGCAGARETEEAVRLATRAWYPENRILLQAWLTEVSTRDPGKRKVAVFDFDNTTIFHDVGEATLRYQLDRLELRLTPEELSKVIPGIHGGITRLKGGIPLAEVREDLIRAYRTLHPHIVGGTRGNAIGGNAHRDFRAKLVWFYEQAYATDGLGALFAYSLAPKFMAGYTEEEVHEITRKALAAALAEAPGRLTWESATAGSTGQVSAHMSTGLRVQPEIVDLMQGLRAAGVEVFVVSSSAEAIVEAAIQELGYPVNAEHIYGLRVQVGTGGRLLPALVPTSKYPITYRQGKVDLIRRFIGVDPILVAGDTFTDYEMLVGFDATEVRLVINRNKGGEMLGLYHQAMRSDAPPGPGAPRVLLQGRDESAGSFRRAQETVPLGKRKPRAISR